MAGTLSASGGLPSIGNKVSMSAYIVLEGRLA
jgi:hypothetical protein